MGIETEPQNWYRDEFLLSTEQSLLQIDAIYDAMDSDVFWWTPAIPKDTLRKALRNSLSFGLYELPHSTSQIASQETPKQIGLMRVITDDVTFAYLTDVYVLPEYQGKGLGRWMLGCLDEAIKAWPLLRRFMLLTSSKSINLYKDTLAVNDWVECGGGLVMGMSKGPGAAH
ncbi:hypothetical protein NPX13_g6706 [Xylaria arbuscula]|uniref:N-acetyltransferase domain-containing protein n=1 Tax=Xylaria arbuscula TaxID=114810 RepID=A0A9W8TL58_9PEZI|nr:hypothetical protein NPX13_g6706 [Xylaria arbuscula]